MKRLLRDYGLAVGSYAALIALGLVLTLTISSAVGYLPYSDRPGPGWIEPSFSFGQVGYYLSWSVLLLPPTAIYGTMLFAWLRVLSVLGTPRLLLKVFAALGAGLLANVLAAGVGWYIAIAAFPVYVATALGAGWGALLLPRYLGPRPPPRSRWMRWAGSSLVMLGGVGAAYWTFLAPPGGQTLSLSVVRVTLSEGERNRLAHLEAGLETRSPRDDSRRPGAPTHWLPGVEGLRPSFFSPPPPMDCFVLGRASRGSGFHPQATPSGRSVHQCECYGSDRVADRPSALHVEAPFRRG